MTERESKRLWSTTALTNGSVDPSINFVENQLPSTLNNSNRAMMAALAREFKDTNGSLTTTGSANAYLLTINNTWTAYATGQVISFKASFTNTAAATINVTNADATALGVKAIRGNGDIALPANVILQDGHYLLQYDAAANSAAGAWILLNWTDNQVINRNISAAAPTPPTGTVLHIVGVDGGSPTLNIDAFGAGVGSVSFRRAKGTNAAPTTLVANDAILSVVGDGYDGIAFSGAQVGIAMYSAGTWSGTSHPTYMDFFSTATSSTTITSRGRVETDGGLTWPSTVTGGSKGAGTINITEIYRNGTALATVATSASAADLSSGTLPAGRMPALTGDVTTSAGAVATTLATVNSNVGTFGSATQASQVAVNAKGLVTAAANVTVTPAVGSITGLGTGVATFLATPSSANLAAALTDETGTGAAVFATNPVLTTPNLGTPSAINLSNATSLPLTALPSILAARMSFHANKNASDQTISDATVTKVTFTTEEWDIGSAYDAANSKWTPTVAGKYLVGLQLRSKGTFAAGAATAAYIYQNGAVVKDVVAYASSTTDTFASVLTTVNMNGSTDYLEAYIFSDVSAGSPTVDGTIALVFFYGTLLQ